MNENQIRGGSPASDPIAALLRSAGPRATPDAQRMELARENVHAVWREVVIERRRERWQWLAASLAAISIGAIVLVAWMAGTADPVATVSRVAGDVRLLPARGSDGVITRLQGGESIAAGEQVETGIQGRVLLTWPHRVALRMDRQSLVGIRSSGELQLVRGTVYVEIPAGESAGRPFAVSTRFGEVRHVGTRFEVHLADDHVRVRVRDGTAIFSAREGGSPTTVAAGQQLSAGLGTLKLEQGPGLDADAWGWTQQIAPELEIEGRSLSDALAWLSHESGVPVVYENEHVAEQARGVVLRGSIVGLDADAAFRAVLSGSGLGFTVHPDRIEIHSGSSD